MQGFPGFTWDSLADSRPSRQVGAHHVWPGKQTELSAGSVTVRNSGWPGATARWSPCTPVCALLWHHRCYYCCIVMSYIEHNTAISLVEKFNLLMNINEWIAPVQIKHLTETQTKSTDCIGACVITALEQKCCQRKCFIITWDFNTLRPEQKWPPFSRQQFYMHFLVRKLLYFNSNLT